MIQITIQELTSFFCGAVLIGIIFGILIGLTINNNKQDGIQDQLRFINHRLDMLECPFEDLPNYADYVQIRENV